MRFKKFLISIILVKTIQISFSQNMYAPLNLEITDSSLANTGLSWETPEVFKVNAKSLIDFLDELKGLSKHSLEDLTAKRYEKFKNIGV